MTDAQNHLDTLARDLASPVPAGLLDTARGARRRRTRGRLAAAGVVLAIAGVAIAVTLPGGTTPRPEVPVASPTATGPVAPAGTRWVSQDGYMVAVPREWVRTRTFCSAVRDEGPGFYYLETDDLQCLPPEASPSVGLLTRYPVSQPEELGCNPDCSRTVVDGTAQLRFKKMASAEDITAISDTLQPLPDSWFVDPTTGEAAPAAALVDTVPVTETASVVGEWLVVGVPGGPVPRLIEPRLTISSYEKDSLTLAFPVSCNTTWRIVRLAADGSLGGGTDMMSTYAGCAPDADSGASGGFGVQDVTHLGITPGGELVLLGAGDEALAVYERA